MATGPEHYQQAERLLDAANRRMGGDRDEWTQTPQRRAELRAEAQVHATLALAAATALNDSETGMQNEDYRQWRNTASARPPIAEPEG